MEKITWYPPTLQIALRHFLCATASIISVIRRASPFCPDNPGVLSLQLVIRLAFNTGIQKQIPKTSRNIIDGRYGQNI